MAASSNNAVAQVIIRLLVWAVRFGSVADLNDTPKAAAQAAGIEGIADLAIHQIAAIRER